MAEEEKTKNTAIEPKKAVKQPEKKAADDKPKGPNAVQKWYRETMGELRKVSWPTPQDAWHLTKIVLLVMFLLSAALGLLDFIFSTVITRILA